MYHTEEARSLSRYLPSTYHVPGTALTYEHAVAISTVRSLTSHRTQARFHCSQMCAVGMVAALSDQAGIEVRLPPKWSLGAP